jgi:hypothetical protein
VHLLTLVLATPVEGFADSGKHLLADMDTSSGEATRLLRSLLAGNARICR